MNLDVLKDAVASRTARQVLLTQKHSPKILFAAGVVGVVGTTVLACRATLKLDEVLEQHEKAMSTLDTVREHDDLASEEIDKLAAKSKLKVAVDVTKLYAPAVGLGILSIGALTGSHVVLTKRNAGLMAVTAAVQKGLDQYRDRVRAELGDDKERELAYGAELHRVEEKLADGKTKITDTKVVKDPQIGGSAYAVVFDERSGKFTTEPGMNQHTVMMVQNYANDKLRSKGHLFLNEVYDMLELPRTKAGQHVGWVYRNDSEPKTGDNYVSFGVFDGDAEWVEAFMANKEKYAILDFNVDGVILDLI